VATVPGEKMRSRAKNRFGELPQTLGSQLVIYGFESASVPVVFDHVGRFIVSADPLYFFGFANAAKAMAAAEVRFFTSSLQRMCSTCLQMVPVHALRMTPIS
jgi:hypothetical protein